MRVDDARLIYKKSLTELSDKHEKEFNDTIEYIKKSIQENQAEKVYTSDLSTPVVRKLESYGYTVISNSFRNETAHEISGWKTN